mgnify:CR=1 FL=1
MLTPTTENHSSMTPNDSIHLPPPHPETFTILTDQKKTTIYDDAVNTGFDPNVLPLLVRVRNVSTPTARFLV